MVGSSTCICIGLHVQVYVCNYELHMYELWILCWTVFWGVFLLIFLLFSAKADDHFRGHRAADQEESSQTTHQGHHGVYQTDRFQGQRDFGSEEKVSQGKITVTLGAVRTHVNACTTCKCNKKVMLWSIWEAMNDFFLSFQFEVITPTRPEPCPELEKKMRANAMEKLRMEKLVSKLYSVSSEINCPKQ